MDNIFIWLFGIMLLITVSQLLVNRKISKKDDSETNKNLEQYKSRYKKKYIMSLNEKSEFWKLKGITDKLNLMLFTKVRMADIVEPIKNDYTLLNKIIRKHFDFVIVDKKGNTICIVELDDNSHNNTKQQNNDIFKDYILHDVGIPIIRKKGIVPEEIEAALLSYINH